MSGHKGIHTSDRILFKRCRRKWNWQSPLKQHLRQREGPNIHLFFGSGIHFALEDYYGSRRFQHPTDALIAYVQAHKDSELPDSWDDEQLALGIGMLEYYTNIWGPKHIDQRFRQVYSETGDPFVEVKFSVPLHAARGVTKRHKVGKYTYDGTFDRIVQDEYGRFWILDYKTAQRFDTVKLETDPQVSAYTWAAEQYFGFPFEGMIWVQMLKDVPKAPRVLKNGDLSTAKNQLTTYKLYYDATVERFGNHIPPEYLEVLNALALHENESGDRFIRYDMIRRNEHAVQAEEAKIVMEAREMADPKLPLYPNPTRDCAWDCPFRSPCLAMDDGSDYQYMLEQNFEQIPENEDRDFWRARIKWPDEQVKQEVFSFI